MLLTHCRPHPRTLISPSQLVSRVYHTARGVQAFLLALYVHCNLGLALHRLAVRALRGVCSSGAAVVVGGGGTGEGCCRGAAAMHAWQMLCSAFA